MFKEILVQVVSRPSEVSSTLVAETSEEKGN